MNMFAENGLRDISKIYPKIKIMIKHHSNLKDNIYEKKFFENTNVISLIDDNSNNKSYGYIYQSSVIFHLHQQLF